MAPAPFQAGSRVRRADRGAAAGPREALYGPMAGRTIPRGRSRQNSASVNLLAAIRFEGVASYDLDVDIAYDGERDHPLATTLANFAERIKRSRESYAGFLHELAARSSFGVLAFIQLALGDRPCAFVLLAPVRADAPGGPPDLHRCVGTSGSPRWKPTGVATSGWATTPPGSCLQATPWAAVHGVGHQREACR
jgi:hypothetical protein